MVNKESLYLNIGFSLWALTVLIICILVFIAPLTHTVVPVYHEAVERWGASKSLYTDTANYRYFYFPQFALIFSPFHCVPMPFSDILWRIFEAGLLVTGMWKMVKLLPSSDKESFFLCMSLVVLTPCIGAMRNGQANVLFAALMVYSIVALAQSRWWPAAVFMIFSLAVKPIGLVLILLAVIVYPLTIWRLVIGLCIFLLLPFLFADSSYVFSQYQQSLSYLLSSSLTAEYRFSDLNGLLRSLGIGLTGTVSQSIRIIAGILFAGLWWKGSKQMSEPERSFLLLGLTGSYLMLFNPMTEGNSYVIVAPSIAYYAIYYLKDKVNPKLGWSLVFMGLSIGLLPELLRPFVNYLGLWWHPLMMIFFLIFLSYKSLVSSPSEKKIQATQVSGY
ncbi:MAG TPA: glycosyltransferase family 87 protein [Thermodesulfovibrionales bacterium]|nr:glycosyltransferase family 87 protein [Thermodesulfovibrionales bacterium]